MRRNAIKVNFGLNRSSFGFVSLHFPSNPPFFFSIAGKEMEEIFALIVSMILIAAVIPLFLWKRRVDSRSREEEDAAPPPPVKFSTFNFIVSEMDLTFFFFRFNELW